MNTGADDYNAAPKTKYCMKMAWLLTLVSGLTFLSCNQNNTTTTLKTTSQSTDSLQQPDQSKDKEAIQNLIRKTLQWAESKKVIDLLPTLTDSKDSTYTGFDLNKLKANLAALSATGFFSKEFIENYNQIILTLDRKLKNNKLDPWLVGDLPTFAFANDIDPWTLCQDVPYDKPSPWDYVVIDSTNFNNETATSIWKWGKLESNTSPDWKKFSYQFRAVKENGQWKIAYLQGFDLKEGTRKDGQ